MPFEIITVDGSRFRFNSDEYSWGWGLQQGTIDTDDKTVVEVYRDNNDGDTETVQTFTQVIVAGNVTEATALVMPRERLTKQCPRCGYCEA